METQTLLTIAMILATLFSPVIAVQVTRFLDKRNYERNIKLHIYKTLMETRMTPLANDHVVALNRIPLEFSSSNKKEKPICDDWQVYMDHLTIQSSNSNNWDEKRINLLIDLLFTIGNTLGYKFNKAEINKFCYQPVAHSNNEENQNKLRKYLIEVFEGERTIPIKVDDTNVTSEKVLE